MSVDLHPSFFVLLAIAAFLVWRIVVRVRRMVGRQRIAPVWPWLSVTFFPAVLVGLIVFAAIADPRHPLAILGGTVLGAGLGWYGLRRTRFEKTAEGWYYTPSAPIGLVLAAVFVARLTYRAWLLAHAEAGLQTVIDGFGQSPLTLGVFALAAGHYAVYAGGLLHWRYVGSQEAVAGEVRAPAATSRGVVVEAPAATPAPGPSEAPPGAGVDAAPSGPGGR